MTKQRTTEDQAREVLADWLAARSAVPAVPWTADVLLDWDVTTVEEWFVFIPPGQANRTFLVDGNTVFSFAPSQLAPPDALAAARAARAEGDT